MVSFFCYIGNRPIVPHSFYHALTRMLFCFYHTLTRMQTYHFSTFRTTFVVSLLLQWRLLLSIKVRTLVSIESHSPHEMQHLTTNNGHLPCMPVSWTVRMIILRVQLFILKGIWDMVIYGVMPLFQKYQLYCIIHRFVWAE